MTKRKTLKELTIRDNFMFSAVMCEEDNCKRFLELVLEFPIARVEVSKEKSLVYHPEYAELPDSYVIFICDFDPFGCGKYRYSFRNACKEDSNSQLEDGVATIFLSTKGTNADEVSEAMVKFLKYVGADLKTSMEDFGDDFVCHLQKSVHDIKQSRRMEERYMFTSLLMQDERRAGRLEGRKDTILESLSEFGSVPSELEEKIKNEKDVNKLKAWTKLVIRIESIEQFLEEM